ncbi:hypothetical protein LTR49_022888 [Elasticomyces elasticus]|nr:hypothetical protein LTR49_022888 [Elasticomyces elasticus]
MNGAGVSKRRSARLSHEGIEGENEPPAKKSKANGVPVSTKEQDGDAAKVVAKRKPRKTYDEDVDGFAFNKGTRKAKEPKQPAVRNSVIEDAPPVVPAKIASPVKPQVPAPVPTEEAAPKPAPKKTRRRFPTTPEREAAERPKRRSKRLSSENESSDPVPSPFKPAHAKSHANAERSPSPDKARPVTVSKKRKVGENGGEEEQKVMRIALPFQDTPVIRRNKEMRKGDSNEHRRSSSGMRGQRASSLMDEGRGNGTFSPIFSAASDLTPLLAEVLGEHDRSNSNMHEDMLSGVQQVTPLTSDSTSPVVHADAFRSNQDALANDLRLDNTALPHTEVPTAEFFKHISADITEPRRMRCLLGWCGTRALPPKPEAPRDSSGVEGREFQALQAARVIQAELSQDLVAKGMLSDWFSRDEGTQPVVPLRRAANPRNVANAAKAEELEGELERLKAELASWEALKDSAIPVSPPSKPGSADVEIDLALSPLHDSLLDSPQLAMLEELRRPATTTDPEAVQTRLRGVAEGLEFSVDSFAQGVHALTTSRATAERLAERSLGGAAQVLEGREKARKAEGRGVDPLEALRGLGRVLNGRRR